MASISAIRSPTSCSADMQKNIVLVSAAVFCAFAPLEISHLIAGLIGAAAYLLYQASLAPTRRSSPSLSGKCAKAVAAASFDYKKPINPTCSSSDRSPPWRKASSADGASSGLRAAFGTAAPGNLRATKKAEPIRVWPTPNAELKPEVRKPSAMPVSAPTFEGVGWEAEVTELLGRILPTAASEAAVVGIAKTVRQQIRMLFPEAEVTGFASANLSANGAFGVAVPEVDIVIRSSPGELRRRLAASTLACRRDNVDEQKLNKSAIRACTERLVGNGAFKFRRSAFRGEEPKVVIVAPATPGICDQAVPMNLCVNASTPFYNMALITECGNFEPRAKELILLVKRWAKDRGLCHAAKGHLPPYGWTLLTIFFLQVGERAEGALLPPVANFEASATLRRKGRTEKVPALDWQKQSSLDKASVAQLFKDFVCFYAGDFDWSKEVISARLGQRGAPPLSLPLHIVDSPGSGKSQVGPSLEDPFEVSTNVGACTNHLSVAHLHAEFKRAHEICQRGGSLTELLEPWAPPEAAEDKENDVVEEHEPMPKSDFLMTGSLKASTPGTLTGISKIPVVLAPGGRVKA